MRHAPEIAAFFHEPTNTVSYVVADPETGGLRGDRQRARLRPGRGAHRRPAHADAMVAHIRAHGLTARLDPRDPRARRPPVGRALPARHAWAGGSRSAPGSPPSSTPSPRSTTPSAASPATARSSTTCSRTASASPIGGLAAEYLATPGHTPACGSYRVGDNIFVGDTLFMPDYGTARCDFPGGDARTMYRSIRRILAYHPQTVLWLCHDYKAPGPRRLRLAHHGRRASASRTRRSATASARTSSWRCARRGTPRSARRSC